MPLTSDQIFEANDIEIKEIPVPEWGGTLYIKQLTRAQQDEYLKRQFGARMRQDTKAKTQEIDTSNMFGHDAYLLVCAVCDERGTPVFKQGDVEKLKTKNGKVVGQIAKKILEFSGMSDDDKIARGEKTENNALEDEIKNS